MGHFAIIIWLLFALALQPTTTLEEKQQKVSSAVCMLCTSGCSKFGSSKPQAVLLPSTLDLASEVGTVNDYLKAGNEPEISNTADRLGLAFDIVGIAATLISGVMTSKAIDAAADQISAALELVAEEVSNLATTLQIGALYNQYMPNRADIRYKAMKMQELMDTPIKYYPAKLKEFIDIYEQLGRDQSLIYMYDSANLILSEVSGMTGCFRRIVVDFGNDILRHLVAGVSTYYAYSSYKMLDPDSVLRIWNERLLAIQAKVSEKESICMNITNEVINSYMNEVFSVGCPFDSNEHRSRSTYEALSDKFDWMLWTVTGFTTPHGPHSHDEDELSGPQGTRIGTEDYQVVALYINNLTQVNVMNDQQILSVMANAGTHLNCDESHNYLRRVGIGGTLLCVEKQLNEITTRVDEKFGCHVFIGGHDNDVWIIGVDAAPKKSKMVHKV